MKMPKSGKMDVLAQLLGNHEGVGLTGKKASAAAAKAGKSSGLLGSSSSPAASTPDFSGLLSGLLKSQLGTGKPAGQGQCQGPGEVAAAKISASVSTSKAEGQKKPEKTRESRSIDREKENAEEAVHKSSAAAVAPLAILPGAMWVAAKAPKSSEFEVLAGKQQSAFSSADVTSASVVDAAKNRDPRRALIGGDLALALATLAKSGKADLSDAMPARTKDGEKGEKGEKKDGSQSLDGSIFFEKATAATRSSGIHGVLDKSSSEATHPLKDSLSALSPKKESELDEVKSKSSRTPSQTMESFRMELLNGSEAKSPVSNALVTPDVRAEVLAPDPTAADLNIRGSVQGQSAKLVVDAGAGLGEIELHLRVRQGVASIRIEGDSAAMVASHTDELRRSVESQGLTLGTVEISRPAADAPISNASNMMQARSDRGDHSGGNSRERMETRLEEGTVRGQPATLSSQHTSIHRGDGSVDVQA